MIKPRSLSPGDRVAIVAPAGALAKNSLDRAIGLLKAWGLEVITGRHVYGKAGYFAGTDEARLEDLQNALDDPTIMAILFARGGYGTTRILDDLNLETLKLSPKWLIGFSDLTALHLKSFKSGILSIHGDVGTTLGRHEESTMALKKLLFEGLSIIEAEEPFRIGTTSGTLLGGNLSLILEAMGTTNEITTAKAILFLEEIEEKTYRIDRMLHQLKRTGKLSNLAGLVIGQFTKITDGSDEFGSTWRESIQQLVEPYDYPVSFGFPIGHEPNNFPVIHGARYQLDVGEQKSSLKLL